VDRPTKEQVDEALVVADRFAHDPILANDPNPEPVWTSVLAAEVRRLRADLKEADERNQFLREENAQLREEAVASFMAHPMDRDEE